MSFNDELGDQSLAKEYLDRASAILLKKLGSENVEFASSYLLMALNLFFDQHVCKPQD